MISQLDERDLQSVFVWTSLLNTAHVLYSLAMISLMNLSGVTWRIHVLSCFFPVCCLHRSGHWVWFLLKLCLLQYGCVF